MKKSYLLLHLFFIVTCIISYSKSIAQQISTANKPNIIYILTDDLGYGDVKCNNPEGKIATPNIDQLAVDGMRFTDAHSGSGVCTPTRYGILTGRYAWRTKLQTFVLWGYAAPLISPQTLTVPELLRQRGYHTACIGKWHLGMGWTSKTNTVAHELQENDVDFSVPIKQSPISFGFDYFYGISASLDMPPYVFIENDKTITVPDEKIESKLGHMRAGLKDKDYDFTTTLATLSSKSTAYIELNKNNPFFMYIALPSPHTPLVTGKAFQGKSGINEYADYVMETDWFVGEIVKELKKQRLNDNTLIVLTSDNGYAPYADYAPLHNAGHEPSYIYRGAKADIYEGGHRVPFIVKWPAKIKAGTTNNATICHTDLMATVSDLLHIKLPNAAGPDSYSLLPLLKQTGPGLRPATVHHSIDGNFSIRKGKWKLIFCPGSGGWAKPINAEAAKLGLPEIQLYNMATDPSEKNNLQAQYPAIVKKLTGLMKSYIDNGRSTPGKRLKNDVPIDMWKRIAAKKMGV